jgi:hypothetical protein
LVVTVLLSAALAEHGSALPGFDTQLQAERLRHAYQRRQRQLARVAELPAEGSVDHAAAARDATDPALSTNSNSTTTRQSASTGVARNRALSAVTLSKPADARIPTHHPPCDWQSNALSATPEGTTELFESVFQDGNPDWGEIAPARPAWAVEDAAYMGQVAIEALNARQHRAEA